jgi:hypothetical protein
MNPAATDVRRRLGMRFVLQKNPPPHVGGYDFQTRSKPFVAPIFAALFWPERSRDPYFDAGA